jgi:hypothetical protein
MKTLERLDFEKEYGVKPSVVSKCEVGKSVKIGKRKLTVKKVEKDKTGFSKTMVISENGVDFILDLAPHWERGPEGPIHICRDGAMNLVRGVYAQTEKDYEELFLGDMRHFQLEKIPGESFKEYEKRRKAYKSGQMKGCEEFLGPVLIRYSKIKALWKSTHDVNEIAKKLGETTYHISCVVDRLGLNRTETGQDGGDEW